MVLSPNLLLLYELVVQITRPVCHCEERLLHVSVRICVGGICDVGCHRQEAPYRDVINIFRTADIIGGLSSLEEVK